MNAMFHLSTLQALVYGAPRLWQESVLYASGLSRATSHTSSAHPTATHPMQTHLHNGALTPAHHPAPGSQSHASSLSLALFTTPVMSLLAPETQAHTSLMSHWHSIALTLTLSAQHEDPYAASATAAEQGRCYSICSEVCGECQCVLRRFYDDLNCLVSIYESSEGSFEIYFVTLGLVMMYL